jgi:hypothetical protein
VLGLDVGVDSPGDRLVCAAGFVLVDQGRTLAVMTHPSHEIPQPGAAGRRERVARMAQIVKGQTFRTDRPYRVGPGASCQDGGAMRRRRPGVSVGSAVGGPPAHAGPLRLNTDSNQVWLNLMSPGLTGPARLGQPGPAILRSPRGQARHRTCALAWTEKHTQSWRVRIVNSVRRQESGSIHAMMTNVHLTSNELTAASSIVAALAIVGGYLGVTSANRNALKIARQERSAQKENEFNALKRSAYAQCIMDLTALRIAGNSQEKANALLAATERAAILTLTAPADIVEEFGILVQLDGKPPEDSDHSVIKLRLMMRADLEGEPQPASRANPDDQS